MSILRKKRKKISFPEYHIYPRTFKSIMAAIEIALYVASIPIFYMVYDYQYSSLITLGYSLCCLYLINEKLPYAASLFKSEPQCIIGYDGLKFPYMGKVLWDDIASIEVVRRYYDDHINFSIVGLSRYSRIIVKFKDDSHWQPRSESFLTLSLYRPFPKMIEVANNLKIENDELIYLLKKCSPINMCINRIEISNHRTFIQREK